MGRLWLPLSAVVSGLGEPELNDFRPATEAQYVASTSVAFDAMMPTIGVPTSSGGIIMAPMQTQVSAMAATLESSSGLSLGNLASMAGDINRLTTATSPSQIVAAVSGVVDDAVDIVGDIASAVGVAADVIEVIPIVGQVLNIVLGFVGAILGAIESAAEKAAAAKRQCAADRDKWCTDLNNDWGPTHVSRMGPNNSVTFADEFRRLAYLYQKGSKHYPPTLSTLMLMACGGAAGDFGMSELRYQELVKYTYQGDAFRKMFPLAKFSPPKNLPVGPSFETRQRMWKLIQAIMACSQDPRDEFAPVSDQGRTAGPVLMDIFRTSYFHEKDDLGHDPLILYTSLMYEGLRWTVYKCPYAIDSDKMVAMGPAALTNPPMKTTAQGCGDRMGVNLAKAFVERILSFNNSLKFDAGFWDEATNTWKALPSGLGPRVTQSVVVSMLKSGKLDMLRRFAVKKPNARGALVLSSAANKKLLLNLQKIKNQSSLTDKEKALAATGAVVLGGSAFMLARRMAKTGR